MKSDLSIGYDYDPYYDPQSREPRAVAVCAGCEQDIYTGEVYGRREDGACCCRDCIKNEFLALTDRERFERMGYDAKEARVCP